MTTARDDVLSTIRRSLGVSGTEATRRAAVMERLSRAPRGVMVARSQVTGAARVALFVKQAEASLTTVVRVTDAAQVPGEIARYLRDNNLPATLRMGDDLRLAAMPWQDTVLEVSHGASLGHDLNAVSHAFAGIAETGTLALTSGPDNPTTLNFLPDNHVVVLKAADISGDYEEMWGKVRDEYGKSRMPRALNWITGPSRSGDIEQTILLGAHGPRRLHIVLIDD